jgi:hypothetical protein
MGLGHSPTIITNGLFVMLDAGNVKSYPGTGLTWTDITRNAYDGTLQGITTFSSSNLGSFSFNGTTDYISLDMNVPLGTAFTIGAWVRPATGIGATAGSSIIYGPQANGADNYFAVTSGNRTQVHFTRIADVDNVFIQGVLPVNLNSWNYLAMTLGISTVVTYVNGAFDIGITTNFEIGSWTSVTNSIGRRSNIAQRYWVGNISNVHMYNRVLSQAEIQQNFNALRGRYGI